MSAPSPLDCVLLWNRGKSLRIKYKLKVFSVFERQIMFTWSILQDFERSLVRFRLLLLWEVLVRSFSSHLVYSVRMWDFFFYIFVLFFFYVFYFFYVFVFLFLFVLKNGQNDCWSFMTRAETWYLKFLVKSNFDSNFSKVSFFNDFLV